MARGQSARSPLGPGAPDPARSGWFPELGELLEIRYRLAHPFSGGGEASAELLVSASWPGGVEEIGQVSRQLGSGEESAPRQRSEEPEPRLELG